MRPQPPLGRSAGLVVPLFSLHSSRSAGIGEIGDLAPLGAWMRRAGLAALQLLPVGTLPAGETSPYSALSAMAIDPVYISLADVADLQALGGEVRLPLADQIALKGARARLRACGTPPCDRPSRARCAWRSACSGTSTGCARRRAPGRLPPTCRGRSGGWATTRSTAPCANDHGDRPWTEWPAPLRERQPEALDAGAARSGAGDPASINTCNGSPTRSGRRRASSWAQTRLFGDFPFMVSADSADVWANQHAFRFDRTVGTPPDAFSATGQDWGLPVYRWDVMAAEDDRWLRQRARRMARLYDGYRVDHLVGLLSAPTHVALGEALGDFDPGDEAEQRRQGERDPARCSSSTGAQVTAEDLGLIPDFVRASLARLQVPGYKVLRWERDWHRPGTAAARPRDLPPRCRSPRPARTTSSRSRCGGRCSTPVSAPTHARRARPAPPARRGLRAGRPRRAADAGLRRPGPICCCCRSRTSSAGADRVNTPGDRRRAELDVEAAAERRGALDRCRGARTRRCVARAGDLDRAVDTPNGTIRQAQRH